MFRYLFLAVILGTATVRAQAPERIPAYILQLPDAVGAVFIAETDSSTLFRYASAQSVVLPGTESYMSVGQNGVGKVRAGDRRTPLGIYFVSEELDTSGLHEKYGPLAFPLDYPNEWDDMNLRTGDGIWIHGVDPKGGRRPPLDTDGCIALPNDELLALNDDFVPLVTPIIITREIRWATRDEIEETRGALLSALDAWVESRRSGDLYQHLAMYADDFTYRGMTRGEWSAYRLQAFDAGPAQDFALDDIALLGDPEDDDLYLSRFRLTILAGERPVVTTKRLYWRRSADGEFRVVAEDNG